MSKSIANRLSVRLLSPAVLAGRAVGRPAEPWQEESGKRGGLRLTFRFPTLSLAPSVFSRVAPAGRTFSSVSIGHLATAGAKGAPALPSISRYIRLKPGYTLEASAKATSVRTIEGVVVEPAQPQLTDAKGGESLAFDAKAYRTRTERPLVTVSPPMEIGEDRYVLLTVNPCTFDGPGNKLNVAATVTVDLKWVLEKVGPIFAYDPTGPAFLIIYAPALEDAARRLAQWKNRRGLKTDVLSTADITNTVAGLKSLIRTRRITTPLRYVLLLGDVDAIPTESRSGRVTDQRYVEAFDSDDTAFAPRLAIGRMPVRDLPEADRAVSKVIAFERNPPANCDYYKELVFGGYFQDDDGDGQTERGYIQTLETVRSHLVGLGYNVERVYVSNSDSIEKYADGTEIPADVRAAFIPSDEATARLLRRINEGRLIFAHRDHGSESGWMEPPFNRAHLDDVKETVPSNFFSINCSTGQFDDASGTESFAEKLLGLAGGVPSLIAATRATDSSRNNTMTQAIFDGLWPGVLPDFPADESPYAITANRLGDVLNYAKAYVQKKHSVVSGSREHAELYHVVGDPTLELWTERPTCISLCVSFNGSSVVIGLSSLPSGSTLTIWHGDELLARLTPTSTCTTWAVPFALRVESDVRLDVCFKAPRHLYTSKEVDIPQLVLNLELPEFRLAAQRSFVRTVLPRLP